MGHPTIHPTGVTIFDPQKAWNGYTLLPVIGAGAVLIDMNGAVVRNWMDLQGFPNKLLPGGQVMGHLSRRKQQYGYQEQTDLVQVDWEGKILWKFDHKEFVEEPNQQPRWMARVHHDYQRQGNPVGYFVPECEQQKDGKTLLLCHETLKKTTISDKTLLDDVIIEVDDAGTILWSWRASEHFKEMNFSAAARNALSRNPNMVESENGVGNWLNIDAVSYLGPNSWYAYGDQRFHPDNLIWSSRETNICAIIEKASGKIVWQLGPEFSANSKLRRIGQIIGPNHVHMIPKGLPGAGNILIFDTGGRAGYGMPNNRSFDGTKVAAMDRSRVLEINPVTLTVKWELVGSQLGYGRPGILDHRFYSPLGGAAQRLPNGNTLITESVSGHLFEVTEEKMVVWDYYVPFTHGTNFLYRGYRYPYDYVPQVKHPSEKAVLRVDNRQFRVPGAAPCVIENMINVSGTTGYAKKVDACVNQL